MWGSRCRKIDSKLKDNQKGFADEADGEEGTLAKKSAVEGCGEIVVNVRLHGAVEFQRDDFFQEERRLLSQNLFVYLSDGEVWTVN